MIETTRLFNRTETVFILHRALGFSYSWHHTLMLWTTKDKAVYSILNSGIRLFPHCKDKTGKPLYMPADIAHFIKSMNKRFPHMKPEELVPTLYEVETSPAPESMKGIAYRFRKAAPVLGAVTA